MQFDEKLYMIYSKIHILLCNKHYLVAEEVADVTFSENFDELIFPCSSLEVNHEIMGKIE